MNFKKKSKPRYRKDNIPFNDKDLILTKETGFHVTEAYKAARTNIMFSIPGQESKVICITSSFPSEGKTTNCINLAITFAQTGAKVLIIDGDLRKPSVHKKLDIVNELGISQIGRASCRERVYVPV